MAVSPVNLITLAGNRTVWPRYCSSNFAFMRATQSYQRPNPVLVTGAYSRSGPSLDMAATDVNVVKARKLRKSTWMDGNVQNASTVADSR